MLNLCMCIYDLLISNELKTDKENYRVKKIANPINDKLSKNLATIKRKFKKCAALKKVYQGVVHVRKIDRYNKLSEEATCFIQQ